MVQYYQQNDTYKALLHYMNTTLTGLFTLECAMKIYSYGFRVGLRSSSMTVEGTSTSTHHHNYRLEIHLYSYHHCD